MKREGNAVHAIAPTRRQRTVIEDVAQMAAAPATVYLRSESKKAAFTRNFNDAR